MFYVHTRIVYAKRTRVWVTLYRSGLLPEGTLCRRWGARDFIELEGAKYRCEARGDEEEAIDWWVSCIYVTVKDPSIVPVARYNECL